MLKSEPTHLCKMICPGLNGRFMKTVKFKMRALYFFNPWLT